MCSIAFEDAIVDVDLPTVDANRQTLYEVELDQMDAGCTIGHSEDNLGGAEVLLGPDD